MLHEHSKTRDECFSRTTSDFSFLIPRNVFFFAGRKWERGGEVRGRRWSGGGVVLSVRLSSSRNVCFVVCTPCFLCNTPVLHVGFPSVSSSGGAILWGRDRPVSSESYIVVDTLAQIAPCRSVFVHVVKRFFYSERLATAVRRPEWPHGFSRRRSAID